MHSDALISLERKKFHASILSSILTTNSVGVPSNADGSSRISTAIAQQIAVELLSETTSERQSGQRLGYAFEGCCANFLEATFPRLAHLRPGAWKISHVKGRNRLEIANYEQYEHLSALHEATRTIPQLAAALGSDYTITPDIVISRSPEDDEAINLEEPIVDSMTATHTGIRASNNRLPILHASISCKWTIRSDRAQNSRSEALNLIRNRKGHLPSIAVVTAEPLPSRIASIALGTGDIDCVYHFALYELQRSVEALQLEDAADLLNVMISGKRLKDISDLPLDLAI